MAIQIEDAFSEQTGAFVPFFSHIEPLQDPRQEPFTELARIQHGASALLAKGSAPFAARLGRAACQSLSDELRRALAWAAVHFESDLGNFEAFAGAAMRTAVLRFYRRFSPMALVRERRDQVQRDDAIQKGPLAQARFVDEAIRRVRGLQRSAPQLWYVEGAHPDDLAQEVARELLESMAQGIPGFKRYERPGREATLVLIETVRSRIRRECKRQVARHSPIAGGTNLADLRTPLDLLISQQHREELANLLSRCRQRLSRPQKRWFDALLAEAEQRETVRWAHVASALGRNKSNASRAAAQLQQKLRAVHADKLFL